MLKKLLLINELTCRIGNAILLVVICCVSALRTRAILLAVTCYVSALSRAHAPVHYFSRYFIVTVKIRALGSNVAVAIAGSIVWWGSS